MKTVTPSSAPRLDRRYVPAADVAKACGISTYDLENRYRPDDWATPRDFAYSRRGGILYTVASLHRFADSLQAHGQIDAAILLRGFAQTQLTTLCDEPELPLKQVEHVEATSAELERMDAHVARRHRSDIESSRFAWEEPREQILAGPSDVAGHQHEKGPAR